MGTDQIPETSQSSSHQKGALSPKEKDHIPFHLLKCYTWSLDCPLPGNCLSGKKKKNQMELKNKSLID